VKHARETCTRRALFVTAAVAVAVGAALGLWHGAHAAREGAPAAAAPIARAA